MKVSESTIAQSAKRRLDHKVIFRRIKNQFMTVLSMVVLTVLKSSHHKLTSDLIKSLFMKDEGV